MPIFKVTALFQAGTELPRVGGFSESFYTDAATATVAQSSLRLWVAQRRVLMANTVACIGTRVSAVATPGVSFTESFREPGQAGIAADIPQMALQLNVNSADGARRQFQLRGIPDARVIQGEYAPVQWFTTQLGRVTQVMIDSFRLRVTDKTEPQIPVQVIGGDGAFVLTSAMTFAVGDSLQAMRMKDSVGRTVHGNYFVAAKTSSLAGTLANWTHGTITIGRLRRRKITYSPITSVDVVKIGTRKVGRPFVQYSGRRSRGR